MRWLMKLLGRTHRAEFDEAIRELDEKKAELRVAKESSERALEHYVDNTRAKGSIVDSYRATDRALRR